MSEIIKINNQNIQIKEFNGQRVLTFKDIDRVHERVDGTARKRFNDNKKRFIKDTDYIVLKPSDIQMSERTFGIDNVNNAGTTFIAESGYLKIANCFSYGKEYVDQVMSKYFQNDNLVFIANNVFEYEFGQLLSGLFSGIYDVIPQYIVGDYRVDFYIPDLNLVIEYDEEHHAQQLLDDELRERFIKKEINCDFIRVEKGNEVEGLNQIIKYVMYENRVLQLPQGLEGIDSI